ncbi:phosphate signaling complex protein PhoU [Desulfatitalea alkaliphila]|uniref:Phosphate-specific transport system accessory protein PhoU n=1 Tax=Desulfatitalea alkaliphila TaxID=2929485 RepID=A0AA41UI34_9BACT|nr:phosphate signaling complex protein PhoU [Desulfatitalea alkaliphila]MCJ8500325.1 phosphate signaling complex protein PhoU [Desulfatitalea alkaliphila]
MSKHLRRELEKVKKQTLSLGALVEERARMAVQAVENRDDALAHKIIDLDWEVDEMEVEIEEDCLKILALYQPVAVDLRFLIATIKINNDLERIGDEAVNIAERLVVMAKRPPMTFVFDYTPMAEKVQAMLKMSLDALVNLDLNLAFNVITMDDEVDAIQAQAYDRIKEAIKEHPDRVGYLINLLLVSRHLERLADHSTNIAEEVIYLIEGEIVRHGVRTI